jgi:hypothetical protein
MTRPQSLVKVPCREQRAVQPLGVTCTTIRRPQDSQKRGGSRTRATEHE